MENFEQKVDEWLAACQVLINKHHADNYPNLVPPTLSLKPGSRFIKIVRNEQGGGGSVYAFIDKSNGDILKPATWRAPAKHARGNLYDPKNGLGWMGPYGPAYLR